MYLVLAYLWNNSAIGAYSCTSGTPPCPNGPETSGTGLLRTVTISSTAGYLIAAGAPWNKAVATVQVNSTDSTTNSTSTSSVTASSLTSSSASPTSTTSVVATTTSSSSKSAIALTAGYLLVVATSLVVIVGAGLAYLVIRRKFS